MLLERGEVTEAAALLERAYALEPHDPNVTDSIGWARFKLGIIEDRPASGDAPALEGALTLLERAAAMDPGSPVVIDHVGDARWAAGKSAQAVEAWERAMMLAE